MKRLIKNAIQTPDGTIIESRSVHDYRTHTDKNGKTYMIDGGLEYVRSSANGDEKYLSLYDNEPHEVQREVLTWGTYGKLGDEPLTYKPIKDMSINHIKAVLEECHPLPVLRKCMEKELEERDKKARGGAYEEYMEASQEIQGDEYKNE